MGVRWAPDPPAGRRRRGGLIDRICGDSAFGLERWEIEKVLEPKNFVGRAPQQVEEYLDQVVEQVLRANQDQLGARAQLSV